MRILIASHPCPYIDRWRMHKFKKLWKLTESTRLTHRTKPLGLSADERNKLLAALKGSESPIAELRL
jgi:hypothetical protein